MPTITGTWTGQDQERCRVQRIPVELPVGARALRVELEFDPREGVIDLGLLDPTGFRGWSGGARRRFVVMPDRATPGYLPGPLDPGTWQVMLGLHRVSPSGTPYRLTYDFEPGPTDARVVSGARPQRARPRSFPGSAGRRWLPGDLHAHTEHSDGELSVQELADLAGQQGLAFLAVTDHNTISHFAELASVSTLSGLLLLEGQEVTTARGHANAIGTPRWVDFREPVERWRAEAQAQGGVLTINHPLAGDCAWQLDPPPPSSLVEAWHGPTASHTLEALEWTDRHAGVAIGGSDYHRASDPMLPGQPTTWLEVEEPTAAGLVDALCQRRVAVSADAVGPVLLRRDEDLLVAGAQGCELHGPRGERLMVSDDHQVVRQVASGRHRLVTPAGELLALA